MAISRDGAKTFEEPVSAIGNVYQDAALRELPLTARTTTTAGPGTTTTTALAGSLATRPDDIANYGVSSNGQGLTLDNKGNLPEVANLRSAALPGPSWRRNPSTRARRGRA